MGPGRLIAQGTCLLVALLCICVWAPATDAMKGEYLSYFNLPPEGGSSDTLERRLLTYISGATPGSEIRGNITTISKKRIADALISAHDRGVNVYLVQDGTDLKRPDRKATVGDTLHAHLGGRHRYCWEDIDGNGPSALDLTSCASSVIHRSIPTTHHLKNWLFSNTVVNGAVKRYSSWVMSYNLTQTSDEQFNDAFVVNGNKELYDAYAKSFASFYTQRRSNDFYNVAGRGHHVVPSANTEISYSPQRKKDYVAKALSRVDRYEMGCRLRVANLSISSHRGDVISKLRRLKRLGCRVQVAFSGADAEAVTQLRAAHIELRWACRTEIHSKMMLYTGRYRGRHRTMVWGGSHNLTTGSLRVRDEVFVAISRLGIYKNYRTYFGEIWRRSSPRLLPVVVPDVRSVRRERARDQISAAGLVSAFTGESSPQAWVVSQAPRGGARVCPGSTVTMRLRTGPLP